MKNEFHLIKSDEVLTAFHIPTSTIMRLPQMSFTVLENYFYGIRINSISKKLGIKEIRITELLNKIKSETHDEQLGKGKKYYHKLLGKQNSMTAEYSL